MRCCALLVKHLQRRLCGLAVISNFIYLFHPSIYLFIYLFNVGTIVANAKYTNQQILHKDRIRDFFDPKFNVLTLKKTVFQSNNLIEVNNIKPEPCDF